MEDLVCRQPAILGGIFMNNQTGFEVKAEQRQSWVSIAMVWAGGMICVPCLMIGGVLSGGGLSIPQIVASILIGYGLICAYMILIGMAACDTGLPVAVMAEGALGKQGARYIISVLLAFACVGWFGIQSATCGQAFAVMLADILGLGEASSAMIAVSSIVWGLIMLATGLRMCGIRPFPIADMLPAMVLVMPFSTLWLRFIVPLL